MTTVLVVKELIDILPFRDVLTWEKFQTLCTDILYKKFNLADTREYLVKGSAQQGIDVYSVSRGEEKLSVAQCKLVKYLSPKQVLDIVDEFLKGDLVGETKEFILCTSASLSRQKDEEETIAAARLKLFPHGIDFIVWDESGLSKELRNNPTSDMLNIVYRYFGEDVALAFYGDLWSEYLKKIKKVRKKPYDRPVDHLEREIISYSERISNKQKYAWFLSEKKERITLINLLKGERANKKIVLLSIAGFGKTEEIKNTASYFSDEDKLIYPVKFCLRDYEGQPLENILSAYDPDWRNIRSDDLLLLFDGLDETADYHKQAFLNQLNAFVEFNPNIQVVITSRYNAYDQGHPQLRGFDIFLLEELTHFYIENYLSLKLGEKADEFKTLLRERNLHEYNHNPYYLTRLVRFYKEEDITFPKNKVELFERVLFEQLEKDEGTYNIPELKKKLLPVARRLAFCMTLAGKSVITDEEMHSLIPEQETRKLLNHFSKFIRDSGSWSFEHNNLQE